MKKYTILIILLSFFVGCKNPVNMRERVVTSDIKHFWNAYDKIVATKDSTTQHKLLDSLYFDKGSKGLEAIRLVRNYSAQDYINAINNYPKFWSSIRSNTLHVEMYKAEMEDGIEKLRSFYPELKPSKIYFTVGAFRTGGTTLDSLVLIGSEVSMADSSTISDEFPEELSHLPSHFNTNPVNHLVFLNIHEYIHTQQTPIVHNLLSQSIREGVAEFVPTIVLGVSSPNPQIAFGKKNATRIREVYEHELFYNVNLPKWLNSNSTNEFGMRDLAYYVGYQMCENYYHKAKDKNEAIRFMIDLDYSNESEIESFVNKTNYLSAPLDQLYSRFQSKRPTVINIKQFKNGDQGVSPNLTSITIEFSEVLNGYSTSVDFGELGQESFPEGTLEGRKWADDNKSWTIPVKLKPNKQYQILISNNFRTEENIPLVPYLIDFRTRGK